MIETLAFVLTGLGLAASIVYYANILNNTNKTRELQLESQELTRKAQEQALETRQAQLFMSLYETHRSPEFRKQYTRVRDREWTDLDDWQKKYGPENNPDASAEYQSLMSFFDGVGLLVRRELIDISLVHDLMYISTNRIWKFHKPVIYNIRITSGYPNLWEHFEYLSDELEKHHEKYKE